MKLLYSKNCNGVFWWFNRKIDLRDTSKSNPKPIEDSLADHVIDNVFIFEVPKGYVEKPEIIEKYIEGVTPYLFDWDNMSPVSGADELIGLGYEDKEWNFDTFTDKNGNIIDVILTGRSFMQEMDFIECTQDIEKEITKEPNIKTYLEKFKDENPENYKGMKAYITVAMPIGYHPKKKLAKKLGYSGENGWKEEALIKFLREQ